MGRFSNTKEVSYYRLGYDYKGKELGGLNIKKKKKKSHEYCYAYKSSLETLDEFGLIVGKSFEKQILSTHLFQG